MTIYPFQPRPNGSSGRVSYAIDDSKGEFRDGFHEDFDEFDDADETMARFGSIDRQYRHAHRTISAPLLAVLTGIRIPICQAFHRALFGLLEDVGDFDGLIATPDVLIAGVSERVAAAADWLTSNPQPDVARLLAAADCDDEPAASVDRRIAEYIEQHSLGLAVAAGTNPSLTIGSLAALQQRLIDEVLELLCSCQADEIGRLTETAIDLLGRMPDSLRLVGGAVVVTSAVRPDGDELVDG